MQITVSILPASAVKITTQHNHVTKTQVDYACIYIGKILKEYFGTAQVNKWTKAVHRQTAISTVLWWFKLF